MITEELRVAFPGCNHVQCNTIIRIGGIIFIVRLRWIGISLKMLLM